MKMKKMCVFLSANLLRLTYINKLTTASTSFYLSNLKNHFDVYFISYQFSKQAATIDKVLISITVR